MFKREERGLLNNRVPAGSCPRGAVGTPNQRLMVGTISMLKYVHAESENVEHPYCTQLAAQASCT